MRGRYTKTLDANHKDVVDFLRQHGVEVLDCSAVGCVPDLLVRYGQRTGWIEVKVPGSRTTFQLKQLKWMSETRWPVRIVTNREDALEFAKTHEGMLSQQQKDALAGFVLTATKAKYHPAAIERVLAI